MAGPRVLGVMDAKLVPEDGRGHPGYKRETSDAWDIVGDHFRLLSPGEALVVDMSYLEKGVSRNLTTTTYNCLAKRALDWRVVQAGNRVYIVKN